jgi:antitoxin (DNA-binding transcriptional repressor) of toxin-antitoxin stability system
MRAVRAGDEIIVEVEGGFVRRLAPADGVVVELADREVFVPADALVEALRTLGRIPNPNR